MNNTLSIQSIPGMTENRDRCRRLFASSHAPYRPLCGLLLLLIVIPGCGFGGGFSANNVSVTVSPAAATIPTDGQEALQATIRNYCSGCQPLYTWVVSENEGANCTWLTTLPTGPCPGGTIQEPATPYGYPAVKYFAPSTPGTFHVVAVWSYGPNIFAPPTVTKQGTSVITVSP
jgi:hypothetical protein